MRELAKNHRIIIKQTSNIDNQATFSKRITNVRTFYPRLIAVNDEI